MTCRNQMRSGSKFLSLSITKDAGYDAIVDRLDRDVLLDGRRSRLPEVGKQSAPPEHVTAVSGDLEIA